MEEEYEVPSPHEHAVEEETENESNRLAKKIALMTAVLATAGALIRYQSGSAQTEAMFLKNESILKQAEASDQWAYYQAKSMKSHLAEATADTALAPEIRQKYVAQRAKLEKEKSEIEAEAKKLQLESKRLGTESEAKLRPHERLALAMTFIQIAVALAAITVLTRRTWLLWGSIASAVVGLTAAVTAFFIH